MKWVYCGLPDLLSNFRGNGPPLSRDGINTRHACLSGRDARAEEGTRRADALVFDKTEGRNEMILLTERPPLGYHVPVTWVRNRDADTIMLRLRTGQEVAVRLKGIDCDELRTEEGRAAKAFVDDFFANNQQPISLFIDMIPNRSGGSLDVTDILKAASFDRVVGQIFVGDCNLAQYIIDAGHGVEAS